MDEMEEDKGIPKEAIDRVVELVLADKANEVAAEDFTEIEIWLDSGPGFEITSDHIGIMIPHHRIPDRIDTDEAFLLEGDVSDGRLEKLEEGAEPTKKEMQIYQRVWKERTFECPDCDYFPGYRIEPLRHSDGREVHYVSLITGYSFTGVIFDLKGFVKTVDDGFALLRTEGELDIDQ